MLTELPVIKLASALARHASARHRVIAENSANADTPGYRARDVRAFNQHIKEAFTPRATRPGHVGSNQSDGFRLPQVIEDPSSPPSINGNSVSIEAEMIKAAESRGQHAMAQAIYRKAHDLLRLSIGRGR